MLSSEDRDYLKKALVENPSVRFTSEDLEALDGVDVNWACAIACVAKFIGCKARGGSGCEQELVACLAGCL